MVEWKYIDDLLDRIEAGFLTTLQDQGFPSDPSPLWADAAWRRLEQALRKSRSPSDPGPRVKRALIGLTRVRLLRDSLMDANETTCRAVRYALDLGPLIDDVLTLAEQLKLQRSKGARAGGAARKVMMARQRQTVRDAGDNIKARRALADEQPLSNAALARRLSLSFPDLSERTIQTYLGTSRKTRR